VLSVCICYLRYNNSMNKHFYGVSQSVKCVYLLLMLQYFYTQTLLRSPSEVLSVCTYYLCYNNYINKHFQGASQKC